MILQSLSGGTKGNLELRRDAGSPAQSTLRSHIGILEASGALIKHRSSSFPGALKYDLTDAGSELLAVAGSLERWLTEAPGEPLELGGDRAKAAIKGLVDGWTATVLTTLAAGPLSLTELDRQISAVSYPTIERCLETMRLAEQVEVGVRETGGTPYTATDWLRRGAVPLTFGARWEHRHAFADAEPICHVDVDGVLQLITPMLALPAELAGACQLEVKASDGDGKQSVLSLLKVREGSVTLSPIQPEDKPNAWASGTIETWFSTILETNPGDLKLSGDRKLTQTVLNNLHKTLFRPETGELATQG